MMANGIEILENSDIFYQRESGITHTPYETEVEFYSLIKSGETEKVKQMMEEILSENIVAGKMSSDKLRQMKYWAVCCITLATRYAISGGLDETAAFNFSDAAVMCIDRMEDGGDILEFLKRKCLEMTALVAESRAGKDYPYAIRRCIHFISTNLHEKLNLSMLAKHCGISADYLSALFKKTTGQTVTAFIREQRLEASKKMLEKNYSTSEAAYYLGFCSESYFIKCFRGQFGITPKKYIDSKKQ